LGRGAERVGKEIRLRRGLARLRLLRFAEQKVEQAFGRGGGRRSALAIMVAESAKRRRLR
jgi:hypothetical protein